MAGIAPKRPVAPAVRGQRFAVVVARFNEPISKKLLDGALGALPAHAVTAARGQCSAVVVPLFTEPISKKLLDGALGALAAHAVTDDRVEVHWVPGSFELGQAAMTLARSRRFAGVVCVGVV